MITRSFYFILMGTLASHFKPIVQRLDLSTEDEEYTEKYIHSGKHIPELDSYFGQYCKDRVNIVVRNYEKFDIKCVHYNQFDFEILKRNMTEPKFIMLTTEVCDYTWGDFIKCTYIDGDKVCEGAGFVYNTGSSGAGLWMVGLSHQSGGVSNVPIKELITHSKIEI